MSVWFSILNKYKNSKKEVVERINHYWWEAEEKKKVWERQKTKKEKLYELRVAIK